MECFFPILRNRLVANECNQIKLENPNVVIKGDFENYSKEVLTPEYRSYKWKSRTQNVCTAGRNQLSIAADGRVTLCEHAPIKKPFVIGDLNQQSIQNVWDSNQLRTFLSPNKRLFSGTICEDCQEFELCHQRGKVCFSDTFKMFGTMYAPALECPNLVNPPRLN